MRYGVLLSKQQGSEAERRQAGLAASCIAATSSKAASLMAAIALKAARQRASKKGSQAISLTASRRCRQQLCCSTGSAYKVKDFL
jgi:hypothetical protein